eukprot:6176305-Pleurochrysis_carterae.AAC.3
MLRRISLASKFAEDLSYGRQRESEVAHSVFYNQFYVQNGIDAFAKAAYDGAQLFGDQWVTELSVWR